MDISVKRIIWGKCINAGQTCIAPDYILCSRQVQKIFVEKAKELLKIWYTDDPKNSPDLCRIVSEKHFVYVILIILNLMFAFIEYFLLFSLKEIIKFDEY